MLGGTANQDPHFVWIDLQVNVDLKLGCTLTTRGADAHHDHAGKGSPNFSFQTQALSELQKVK